MALALSDFKKTSRTTELGRQLYPFQIRDERYIAALSYAIGYYEQMIGRRRAEFEPATLLEFFGDPKLARGIVACLGRTYRWHTQSLAEILPEAALARLTAQDIAHPRDLRARLYAYANEHHHGFVLPEERPAVLAALGAELGLESREIERILVLDDESQALLVRSGPEPAPGDIIAQYNYHSLTTALRHVRQLTLRLSGQVWPLLVSIRNLARRYKLQHEIVEGPRDLFGQQIVVTWHGRKDALGGWSRHGQRVLKALLRLLSAHPDCPLDGVAQITLAGKKAVVKLGAKEFAALGVEVRNMGQGDEAWEDEHTAALGAQWSRAAAKGQTAGWRLRRDPEPLVLDGAVLVPDFIAVRGSQRLPLFVPPTVAGALALAEPLDGFGAAFVAAPLAARDAFRRRKVPYLAYSGDWPEIAAVVAELERHFPAPAPDALTDRWSQLSALLEAHGFIAEAELPELLGCRDIAAAGQALKGWRADEVQFVPGLGLCTRARLAEISALLKAA